MALIEEHYYEVEYDEHLDFLQSLDIVSRRAPLDAKGAHAWCLRIHDPFHWLRVIENRNELINKVEMKIL